MVPPPLAEVLWVGLCTWMDGPSYTCFNPLIEQAPGGHLPTPNELEECGVDWKCIETGDSDEGAVEGALPHL